MHLIYTLEDGLRLPCDLWSPWWILGTLDLNKRPQFVNGLYLGNALSINSLALIHDYMAHNVLVGGHMVNNLRVGRYFGGWLWFGALTHFNTPTANPRKLNCSVNNLWHYIMHLNHSTWFVVVMMCDNDDPHPTYTTLPEENPNSSQHTDNLYPIQWDGI